MLCLHALAYCLASWGEISPTEELSRAAHSWGCSHCLCSEWNLPQVHTKLGRRRLSLQQVNHWNDYCVISTIKLYEKITCYQRSLGVGEEKDHSTYGSICNSTIIHSQDMCHLCMCVHTTCTCILEQLSNHCIHTTASALLPGFVRQWLKLSILWWSPSSRSSMNNWRRQSISSTGLVKVYQCSFNSQPCYMLTSRLSLIYYIRWGLTHSLMFVSRVYDILLFVLIATELY